ncbi:M30 family zinc metallopeptidase [Roseateles microcysteis]|uniref:M30 family zinc metallopeptidase n=1 Tax=Roseateles microcysteis TaxID=3119057 RepID=UPI002FE615BD
MQKRAPAGRRRVWAGLFVAILLAGCGGGGSADHSGSTPAPKATLSIQLNGPSQVRAGESLQINGYLDQGSASPAAMTWQLLERPASSQVTLPPGESSSQLLSTDEPGRYVVQWTVTGADGEKVQRQLAVDAVAGPLIETSAPTGQLQLGQATVLQARQPTAAVNGLTTYRWTLLEGPSGSGAKLSAAWGSEVSLKADVAGQYQVQVEAIQGETVTKTVRTLAASTMRSVITYPTYTCNGPLSCNMAVGVPRTVSIYFVGTVGNATVVYDWFLRSAPERSRLPPMLASGTAPSMTFTPDAVGQYWIELKPSSGDVNITGASMLVQVITRPTGSIKAPSSVLVGQLATLDASANRAVDGREINGRARTWTLVKAPKGSSAVIQADTWGLLTAKLQPDRPGDYVISLGMEDLPDYATVTLRATSLDPQTVYPPKLTAPQGPFVPGEEVLFKAESSADLGQSIVHEWKFGDGSTATGDEVSHRYPYPGVYQLQVIGRDSVSQKVARQTASIKVVANRLDNIPPAPCAAEPCPAAAADLYAGEGLGRWQLINDQPHAQAVNIDIAGVAAGRQVLVSLSNATGSNAGIAELGQSLGMAARPVKSAGTSSIATYTASTTEAPDSIERRRDEAHAEHLARDRALTAALDKLSGTARAGGGQRKIQSAAPRPALPVPEIGSSRDWNDASTGLPYKSRLADSCSLPGGRMVLFWVDENARSNELLSNTQIADDFKPMACGEKGGFQRLQQLLRAEVFGLHELSYIISDAALQPVNVLLADPGANQYWGAYVYSGDLYRKTSLPRSNEAILMVVNARFIKTDLNFIKSSLVHEFMHQVNNYQRWLLNNGPRHESWLEEMTAMVAEDLVSSELITKADGSRFAPMALRMASYQSSSFPVQFLGGDGVNYSVGGSLAGYLDRRLGASLLRGLTFNCPKEDTADGSFRCLDDQVFQLSGKGLMEHYSAMNLSIAGPFHSEDGPGLGMPPYVNAEVDLPAIDLKTLGSGPSEQIYGTWRLYPGAHIYQWESTTAAAGARYRRKGIMVPPGHVLQIVIR